MIAIVRIALRRPYTFVVLALVILIIGPLAALRTPVDIFPDIRIPVIAVIWQYTGLPPDQMAGRMTTQFQRALTTTVNDIEHIEATSYNTLSITKVFFQPNVDIRIANSQVTAISQTMVKQMPAGATPPLILNYNASTVPIIQLALSGDGLSEQTLADIGLNTLRTPLVTVPGAAIPLPYGGKQRQVQIDLDSAAMQARGLSGQDVTNALAAQNLITPIGTEKIGGFEYALQLNNAPSAIAALGDLPIKSVNGAMVYIRDVAHVRDGNAESCDCCLSIIAGCLVQLVRSQRQMTHISEGGFIVGNRPAEGAARSHQDFNAIEIGTHMGEYAMQLAPYLIYSRLRSHCCFL
jgi:multidrug efflux pump subunit AcrB